MPGPQRKDIFDVFDELSQRVSRLEQAARSGAPVILSNVDARPAALTDAGIFYVENGAVRYRGPNTDTQIAPS
jgi:hypothetical protein